MTAGWIAALILASALQPVPQGGRVVAQDTGAPIEGAAVSVVGATGVARTGADGRFVWTTAPLTPAVIIVTLPDGRVARPIHLRSAAEGVELTLIVEPAVREALTVTGLSGDIDAASGAAMSRIAAAGIAARHPATLVQVLESVPGTGGIGEGQSAAPAIRGLARGRTLILVDGARATSERRAGANAAFVDPATVASVTVVRGPASVAYGSDAIGGVIALQLESPARDREWRGRAAGSMGAGVPEQAADLEVSTGYGSGAVAAGFRARDFGDYRSARGTVDNSAWRDSGARATWTQALGASLVSARWQSDFGRDLGRPRNDSHAVRLTSPVDDSHRLTLSWQRAVAGAFRHLRVDAFAGTAAYETHQDRFATTAPARPRSLELSRTSHRDVQLRAAAERAVGAARILAGLDLHGRYGLRTIDTGVTFNLAGAETGRTATLSIDDASRTAAGLFADVTVPLARRVRASLGGRVDTVRSQNRGGFWGDRTATNSALAGVASISAAPAAGFVVTAQVARGFRDPTLTDRFHRGPVGRGIIEGNPDLRPETSLQMDVTARLTAGWLQAEASAYRYRVTDLIERYSVNANLFRFRNRGDARFRGIEVSVAALLPHAFSLEAGVQWSRGRDGDTGVPLDDVAPAGVMATARKTFGARVTAWLRAAAYASHRDAGPGEVPVPGYEVGDVGVAWRISKILSVRAVARNVLDEAYPGTAGPRWVHAPGRHASVTASIGF